MAVSQVTDDELKEAREKDHILFQSNDFPILHNMTFEEENKCDFKTGLWKLSPCSIDGDVETINNSITDKNIRQKEKYQRLIKTISKSEFINFHALLIAATVYNERGSNHWANNCDIKKSWFIT